MDGKALLNFVDLMQRDKNISRETVFGIIEQAVRLATEKYFGEKGTSEDIIVSIDRTNGAITAKKGDQDIDPGVLGRIAAQAAKQSMIQKFREVECDAVYTEYTGKKGDLVKATVQRYEYGTATVTIGNSKSEAILPRGEQIPGETHHVGDRIDAVIIDVKKSGHRVKIILSRAHPEFVRQLFFKEIPEIQDHTIEIKAIAREAGYRTKVAVSSIDSKVDCVGACVGVRGSRIKNIIEALGGERIDIVRHNEMLQILIKNALQPAEIEEVFLYHRLGRAIVLVQEDQLSLAIGRRGQNVRLGSKLVGWDIEIMTHDEYNEAIGKAETWFNEVPHMTPETVEALIVEGFLSYDDLGNCIEDEELAGIANVTPEQAAEMIEFAETKAEELGDEARTPRSSGDAEGRAIAKVNPAAEAYKVLGGKPTGPAGEALPTFEQLFPEKAETPVEPAATEETPAQEQNEPEPVAVASEPQSASEPPAEQTSELVEQPAGAPAGAEETPTP
jgi:N utilization substance protein A